MKTNLKNVNIKSSYWSDEDDTLLDFYVPALSTSCVYKRIAGFFSSNALAIAAKGLAPFIQKGGKMFLITSVVLSAEDKGSIEQALKSAEQKVIKELDHIEEELKKDHVSMLGWMIKTGTLEMKIAVVPKGLFHPKIGILEDEKGDRLSFSGSENETASGWLHNDEAFHVFKSWTGEEEHLNSDLRIFENLWKGQTKKTMVFHISEALKQKLIKIAPKDEIEFKRLTISLADQLLYPRKKTKVKKEMYDYQKQAVDAWVSNGFKGILEMATGTGKTFTSLKAISEVVKSTRKLLVVVVVPYLYLVSQWKNEFFDVFGDEYFIKEAHSEVSDWPSSLNEFVQEYSIGTIEKVAIFSIYDTFATEKFQHIIQKYLGENSDIMLISDEVHFLGAPKFSNGMREIYKYRLGLSATPQRWFDEEGSEKLAKYFDKTVFKFSLKNAIPRFLTPYDYYPQLVNMSGEELEKYCEIVEKISKAIHSVNKKDDIKEGTYLSRLFIERAKIIVNNREKQERFKDIIKELMNGDLTDHLLVYCSPEQIDWAQDILNEYKISNHRFTFREKPKERSAILEHFERGKVKILVAMRCLDQGLNIPCIKTAIILASSSNPMQYIQRRGRVLRKYPGKIRALIYDFIVLANGAGETNTELFKIEQKIFSRELTRTKEFYETANNKPEVLKRILPIMDRYKVYF